jgi:hypothetical protein
VIDFIFDTTLIVTHNLKKDLLKLKYYLLFLAVALGVFVYAGLTGRRYTGSDSSKWSPAGQQQRYHK